VRGRPAKGSLVPHSRPCYSPTYTVAFTCQVDSAVTFNLIEAGISVVAQQTMTVDFP
jgi:hypothetical protein